MISFTVIGVPAPQGSKTPWGSEANPNTRPWRSAVTYEAKQAHSGDPITGPVAVVVEFFFPFTKAMLKKDGTPKNPLKAPWKSTKPDIDKLARAILDGVTQAGIWRDDSQVCRLAVEKYHGNNPRAHVRIVRMEGEP